MTKFYFQCLALSLVIFGISNGALEAMDDINKNGPACVKGRQACTTTCHALPVHADKLECRKACNAGEEACHVYKSEESSVKKCITL